MGHATHFLQRLDRVDDRQTELALTLYRDDDLLRTVLQSIELPASADRLAVSLDDPKLGPFVVLTRTGRFVTCLGHGMRADGLPVVTRERFDVAARSVQRMRDELGRLEALRAEGGLGQAGRLLRTLEDAGPRFCREDAARLARVQPLIAKSLHMQVLAASIAMTDLVMRVATLRFDRLKPLEEESVLTCGKLAWSIAHLLPFLAGADAQRALERMSDAEIGRLRIHPAEHAFDIGTMTHIHRALWVVARSGSIGLQHVRHMPKQGGSGTGRLFREFGLGAIACASTKRRAEATKALFEVPLQVHRAPERDPRVALDNYAGTVGNMLAEGVIPQQENAMRTHFEIGRMLLLERLAQRGMSQGSAIEMVRELPEDVVRCALATMPQTWHGEAGGDVSLLTAYGLPWLARAPLEALYMPRALMPVLIPELSVQEVEAWLKPLGRHRGLQRPATMLRAVPKVRPNDPCPCGRGQKAKRCCHRPH